MTNSLDYGCSRGHKIVMNSGVLIDFFDPDPKDLRITDIASALSNICRWGGHTKHHYSVAQHCVLCALQAAEDGYAEEVCFACLMHDAAEAVTGDFARPIKMCLPDLKKIESIVERAIEKAFGVDLITHHDIVKKIDNEVLLLEARELLNGSEKWLDDNLVRKIDLKVEEISQEQACLEFLWVYDSLKKETDERKSKTI